MEVLDTARSSGFPLRSALKADHPPCSTTTFFSLRDHHHLKINGYSRSLNSRCPFFQSSPFRAGGHTWRISYRPKGSSGDSDFISLHLTLDDIVESARPE
ncbi:unnamed protein product [Urochloa humidicola]